MKKYFAIIVLTLTAICAFSLAKSGTPETYVSFEGINSLDELEPLGITFSDNMSIWTRNDPSVLIDPDGGAVTPPNGLCADGCHSGTGYIYFDNPQTFVSIFAFSGPGDDMLSDCVRIRAFNSDSALVGVYDAVVAPYDSLYIIAPDIMYLELTGGSEQDGWDNLRFKYDPEIDAHSETWGAIKSIFK